MIQLSEIKGNKTLCRLCPHFCLLNDGASGICGVRKNLDGRISLLTYDIISGYSADPVEKKPLYHFYPGHKILSIGSYGCNMKCDFCQNYSISQTVVSSAKKQLSKQKIFSDIKEICGNIGLAFTYNEPVIWFEYVMDMAATVQEMGFRTVLISNGYVNAEPLSELIHVTDAFNIDLKAFNNDFYKKLTGAGIEPVKSALKQISKGQKHLEITTLVITGRNDSASEMELQAQWIAGELGNDVPLHLSRYFPNYKRTDRATDIDNMQRLAEKASRYLSFVYLGNVPPEMEQNTKCPHCGTLVTIRSGFSTCLINLDSGGHCTTCNNLIYKNFTFSS
jgi:pyruvate formate lyase activating enzyme